MKLNEIVKRRQSAMEHLTLKGVDLWEEVGIAQISVEVEYEYEPADHEDHPYGSTTAREHFPAQIHLEAVILLEDALVYDDEGEVVRTLKAGKDLMKEPFFNEDSSDWFIAQVKKSL
jgi:hypothetical protein